MRGRTTYEKPQQRLGIPIRLDSPAASTMALIIPCPRAADRSCGRFRVHPPSRRTLTSSPTMLRAISSAVTAPIESPMGE